MSTPVYLDYNASAPVRPEAAAAVAHALEVGGNPSSVHAAGRTARAIMEKAREAVASLVGGAVSSIVFTSGGAEANNLVLDSAIATGSRRLIVSAIEHPTIVEAAKASGAAVELLPVDRDGVADIGWLKDRLAAWSAEDGRPFVALMLANNETGVIQPIRAVADLVHAANGWLHVDAIQAVGKIEVDMAELDADSLSLSGHKLGAPQGVGALAFGARTTLVRRQHGGGQERGRRAGTENVPGIAGLGAAIRVLKEAPFDAETHRRWRDAAAEKLKAAGCVVIGEGAPRLPNTLNVAAPGFPSHMQVMALDLAGVMISGGSACSSGKASESPVLAAMDLGDLASCAIRVSSGWKTTERDWNRFVEAWLEAHDRHAARRAASAA
jgi:cysteine desulfurase